MNNRESTSFHPEDKNRPVSENWLGRSDITHGDKSHEHEMGRKFYDNFMCTGFSRANNPNSKLVRELWAKRHNILLLYGGNNINEAEHMIDNHDHIIDLCGAVTEAIQNKSYTTVIIDRQTETLHPKLIRNLDIFGKYMAEHHPDVEVLFFTSSYNAPDANKWCQNIQFVGVAGFMFTGGGQAIEFQDPNHTFYDTHGRPKAMLNLNRLAKPARVYAMALMSERDILKHSLTSMTFNCEIATNWKDLYDPKRETYIVDEYWSHFLPMADSDIPTEMIPYNRITLVDMGRHVRMKVKEHIIDKGLHKENWVIDIPDVGTTNPAFLTPWETPMFQDTWFSFVNETHTEMIFGHTELKNNVFFSEKTTKALAHMHPFVLFSCHGALANLHHMGFKTFEPIIDESYDRIENPMERLHACIEQAEKLCKYSHEDWVEAHKILQPIVEHNNKLINYRNFKLFNLDRPWNIV